MAKTTPQDIQRYITFFAPYVARYGYWAAFFGMMLENTGVPVPAETALIVLSIFAGRGVLNIWLVIPVAILGDITGDSIGFAIGWFGGRALVERWGGYVGITKERLDAAEELLRKRGWWAVFTSQFFSVTRATVPIVVGTSRMPYRRFLSADAPAAAVLITGVGTAAYYFGQNLELVLRVVRDIRVLAAVIVILAAAFFIFNYYRTNETLDSTKTWIILGITAASIAAVIVVSYQIGYLK